MNNMGEIIWMLALLVSVCLWFLLFRHPKPWHDRFPYVAWAGYFIIVAFFVLLREQITF